MDEWMDFVEQGVLATLYDTFGNGRHCSGAEKCLYWVGIW